MRVGCILSCGHNFLILLDFCVHSLLRTTVNSKSQQYVDDLSQQVSADMFQLNEDKRKEQRITFARSQRDFDPIRVNTKNIDCVKKAKFLVL